MCIDEAKRLGVDARGAEECTGRAVFAWWQLSSRCVAMLQCGARGNEVRGGVTCCEKTSGVIAVKEMQQSAIKG
jgi:hypothetical protein